jgi:hypothetical protein
MVNRGQLRVVERLALGYISGKVLMRRNRQPDCKNFILQSLESFLKKKELVEGVSGKLAIVEPGRIRIRS